MSAYYWINIGFSAIMMIPMFFKNMSTEQKKMTKIIFLFGILILLGISFYKSMFSGSDLTAYFNLYQEHGAVNNWEPINIIIFSGFRWLGLDFQVVLIVFALLTLIPVFFICFKYAPFPTLSLALFVALNNFWFSAMGIRQALAISLVLFSVHFIFNKKWLYYTLFIVAAILLHYSAVIALPIFLFNKINFKRWIYFLGLAFSFVFLAINGPRLIVDFVFMTNFLGGYTISASEFVDTYSVFRVCYHLGFIIVAAGLVFFKDKLIDIDKRNIFWINASVFSACLYAVVSTAGPLSRLGLYFTIFDIIGYTLFFQLPFFREGWRKYLLISFFGLGMLIYIVGILWTNPLFLRPLQFIS